MKKVIFLTVFSALTLITYSQGVPNKTLEYYIEYARENISIALRCLLIVEVYVTNKSVISFTVI